MRVLNLLCISVFVSALLALGDECEPCQPCPQEVVDLSCFDSVGLEGESEGEQIDTACQEPGEEELLPEDLDFDSENLDLTNAGSAVIRTYFV